MSDAESAAGKPAAPSPPPGSQIPPQTPRLDPVVKNEIPIRPQVDIDVIKPD